MSTFDDYVRCSGDLPGKCASADFTPCKARGRRRVSWVFSGINGKLPRMPRKPGRPPRPNTVPFEVIVPEELKALVMARSKAESVSASRLMTRVLCDFYGVELDDENRIIRQTNPDDTSAAHAAA